MCPVPIPTRTVGCGTNIALTKKLFDVLAEELFVEKSRGDRIRTCDLVAPNDALYQAELHPEV
jgi:hypothetical protein